MAKTVEQLVRQFKAMCWAACTTPNAEQVADEQEHLRTLLMGWDLNNVFNMDETALFYAMLSNKDLAITKRHGVKQSKL